MMTTVEMNQIEEIGRKLYIFRLCRVVFGLRRWIVGVSESLAQLDVAPKFVAPRI